MSVTAYDAVIATPMQYDISIDAASASGTINVGDYLIYSGNAVIPTALGAPTPSAAGIALEANPLYDQHGRSVSNTALRYMRQGVIRVSASFSGQIPLGTPCYPDATGSGVAGVTGLTGVGATWTTAAPVANSANALGTAVGRVIAWYNNGAAGTGQMDVLIGPGVNQYY